MQRSLGSNPHGTYHNETFFLVASNEHGDFVYGGHTGPNEPSDPNQAAVLIFHDSTAAANDFPVLRTGMRVDMNTDNQLDANDPQIIAFKDHSACLTAGNVLFVVVLLELPSEEVGEALIRFRICLGDADHDGDVDLDDWELIAFNLSEYPPCGTNGDVTADGYVDNNDLSLCEFSSGCNQSP